MIARVGDVETRQRHAAPGLGDLGARRQGAPGRKPRLGRHHSTEAHRPVIDPVRAHAPERTVAARRRVEGERHAAGVGIGSVHEQEVGGDRRATIGGCTAFAKALTRLVALRDPPPRLGVDALDSGPLGGPVAREELRGVGRRRRGLRESVRRLEGIERGIARQRVAVVGHRGVDGVEEEVSFARVGGEIDHRVRAREVEGVQVEGVARGRVAQPLARRRERLVEVEGEQRASARIAAEHHAVEARVKDRETGGHVEEHHLVDQRRVVVEPAAVDDEHGKARGDQSRHGVVVREVRARVHEAHRSFLAAPRVQPAVRDAAVRCLEHERLAARALGQRAVPLGDLERVVIPADSRQGLSSRDRGEFRRCASRPRRAARHPKRRRCPPAARAA